MTVAAACEQPRPGFLEQPANAISSAAFVVAAAAIFSRRSSDPVPRDRQRVFAVLVAGIGVGSFVQHGPHPSWQAYAHDLPLASVLVFAAREAASDLAERELSASWWVLPSLAMVPVVAAGPTASTLAQDALGTGAVGLNLVRAYRRPAVRSRTLAALSSAAAGALVGAIADRTAPCRAGGAFQGHAVWHLSAAAALWLYSATVGAREASPRARGRPCGAGRRAVRWHRHSGR